jgi:hypothetical protein
LATFQTSCGNTTNPTAVQLITNSDGSQDLVVLCNDGFGSGPYWMQRIRDVNSIVANQPLSVDGCTTSVVSDDDDSNYDAGNVIGAAIGVLLLGFFVYCVGLYLYDPVTFMSLFKPSSAAAATKSNVTGESTLTDTEMAQVPSQRPSKH